MSVSDALEKTKLTPQSLLLLFGGVVVLAYVVLGASFLRQHSKQSELSSQIDSAEAVLATADDVRQELEDLPARLAESRRELAAAQAAFPTELDSNLIVKTVLDLAAESQVEVASVDASPPAAGRAEDAGDDNTLSFDVAVAGDFGQLVTFLGALEERATSTTRVSTFALYEADGRYVLDLELVAYARSPVPGPSSDETATSDAGEGTSGDGGEAPGELE